MLKKMLFIINPHSGTGAIHKVLLSILDSFTKAGYDLHLFITQKGQDAYEKVCQDGENYDLLVCSGGDGTLNEIVSGLMTLKSKPLLGYIPAGTVNDFATNLKISKQPLKAAETIVNGVPFYCDIGSFNDRNFTYIAGFGAFTEISYITPQNVKNAIGKSAYLVECLKHLEPFHCYKVCITYDGQVMEDEFVYGAISGTGTFGGFRSLLPRKVEMNDGLFEGTFIRNPVTPLDIQNVVNYLFVGTPGNDMVFTFKASHITVESEIPLAWTVDGEFGGDHTKVEIRNNKQALAVLIPGDGKIEAATTEESNRES